MNNLRILVHRRRNLLIGFGVISAGASHSSRSLPRRVADSSKGLAGASYLTDSNMDILPRTPGVKNIENRYTAAGGAPDHLPAIASELGNPDDVVGNTTKQQGKGTPSFDKEIREQKPK